MANWSPAPLSDWPVGPHPPCNGRFVVLRHTLCVRACTLQLQAASTTPLPSRVSNPPSQPLPALLLGSPTTPPPFAVVVAAALVSRIISKYNHRLLRIGRMHVCTRVYMHGCMREILIHLCTEMSASLPAGHFLSLCTPSFPFLVYDANRQT